jgi:hypothetical protein
VRLLPCSLHAAPSTTPYPLEWACFAGATSAIAMECVSPQRLPAPPQSLPALWTPQRLPALKTSTFRSHFCALCMPHLLVLPPDSSPLLGLRVVCFPTTHWRMLVRESLSKRRSNIYFARSHTSHVLWPACHQAQHRVASSIDRTKLQDKCTCRGSSL